MNKNILIVTAAALLLVATTFKATIAGESAEDAKSVAWYVANIKAARAQNQECHDNPSLQSSRNCVNSLHALEITFKGGN